jgi:hypothetical protein
MPTIILGKEKTRMALEAQGGPSTSAVGALNQALQQDFDRDKAVEHAREHTTPHSKGHCAKRVRQAIEAGGINVAPTHSAKDYGPLLEAAGFVPALNQVGGFQHGDVVVIQGFFTTDLMSRVDPGAPRYCAPGLPEPPASVVLHHQSADGHMAIYDKENEVWISDFEQDRPQATFPGSPGEWYDRARPPYKVYRYLGSGGAAPAGPIGTPGASTSNPLP